MSSYDYIIVGGGTAGCLLASRLANALPNKSILVLEAGKSHTNYPHVLIPGHYLQFLTSEDMSFTTVTVPQSHLNGRKIAIPRAKLVGGGSCANFMTWARGPKCDWDEWAKRTGDNTYAWDNILPLLNDVLPIVEDWLMQQLETFDGTIPSDMEKLAKPTKGAHGTKGPIGVGYGAEWMPLIDTYIEAADEALKCGIIPDYNDGNVVGASVAQFNIAGGERITSPDAFLKTIPDNLTIGTEVEVNRITLQGRKAVGVEITKNGQTGTPLPIWGLIGRNNTLQR
jgi:choline dehydrogenase-like flavoprotein